MNLKSLLRYLPPRFVKLEMKSELDAGYIKYCKCCGQRFSLHYSVVLADIWDGPVGPIINPRCSCHWITPRKYRFSKPLQSVLELTSPFDRVLKHEKAILESAERTGFLRSRIKWLTDVGFIRNH